MVRKTALLIGAAVMVLLGWLRAEAPARDDRGSDSTEKAFMIGLGIVIGGLVVTGATLYVTNKIGSW